MPVMLIRVIRDCNVRSDFYDVNRVLFKDGRVLSRFLIRMDFWNKWHGFLMPIVSKVSQIGSWTAGRDGPLAWTFETNGADSLRPLLQKSIRAGRGVGPWTAGRDGPPGWTLETNGTDSWRRLLQKFVRAGRGSGPWTTGRDGLLRWTFETNGTDSPVYAYVSGQWPI